MIFIDFDDVIFNTKQFKHDFKNMFLEHGVPGNIFDKYYNDPNDSRAIKTFDPWRQIKGIERDINIDVEKLIELTEKFITDISAYVFDDVEYFAVKFGKQNIHIVSFGEIKYQTTKITNSKISQYIDQITVTEDTKAEAIKNILNGKPSKGEKIYFLDDRIEQIRDVKGAFPEIITILIKRPEGRYQEMQRENCCDYQACNLREAEQIIEKYEKEN